MYTRFFSCMFKSWELDLICIWFQPITIPDVTFSFLANHKNQLPKIRLLICKPLAQTPLELLQKPTGSFTKTHWEILK